MLGSIILHAFLWVILPLMAVGCVGGAASVFFFKRWDRAEQSKNRTPPVFHLVQL